MKKTIYTVLVVTLLLLSGCNGKTEPSVFSSQSNSGISGSSVSSNPTTGSNNTVDVSDTPNISEDASLPEDTPEEVDLWAAFQNGDFSYIAGTYTAHAEYAQGYGAECPDINISETGVVTGGGLVYSWGSNQEYAGTPPVSIQKGEESNWGEIAQAGSFVCSIKYEEGTFIPEAGIYDGQHNEFYIIYPPEVPSQNGLSEDISKIRIRYVIVSGGVEDMIYTKNDE